VLDYIYYVIGIVHYHMNWPAIQIVDLWLLRSQRKIRIHTNINIATTDQQHRKNVNSSPTAPVLHNTDLYCTILSSPV